MTALENVRTKLADDIGAIIVDANVYAWPVAVPTTPAIVVVPDEPYLEPHTIGRDPVQARARFRLTALVAQIDNAGSLTRIEHLLTALLAALPTGYSVANVSRPGITTVGPSEMLAADLLVAVPVELHPPDHLEPEPAPED